MTHAYRQFFMGHNDDMEVRYTTNKGMLQEMLTREMRESFVRSEEFLDLEDHMTHEMHDMMQDHKQELQDAIQSATPEQLGLMLQVLGKSAGNIQDPLQSGQQQTVSDADVAEYLIVQHGWLCAGTLPNCKVVLQRQRQPSSP